MSLTSTPLADDDLLSLRQELGGRLAFPGDPGYARAQPWNVDPDRVLVEGATIGA